MESAAVPKDAGRLDDALGAYAPGSLRGDLCRGARPNVAAKWTLAARRLIELSQGAHGNVHEQVAREIPEQVATDPVSAGLGVGHPGVPLKQIPADARYG